MVEEPGVQASKNMTEREDREDEKLERTWK